MLIRIKRFFNLITSPLRSFPDFLIIGVQKGGTTSLFNHLIDSGVVAKLKTKEIHYFTKNYHKSIFWYKSFFPYKWSNKKACGEATPLYLYLDDVPIRVLKSGGSSTKFIVLLRNPIDRAFSHYQHEKRKGRFVKSFEEILEKELIMSNLEFSNIRDAQTFSLLTRGLYFNQITNWLKVFPKTNFLFIQSEKFYSDPSGQLEMVANFLGHPIDPGYDAGKPFNMGGNYGNMSEAIRAKLLHFFEEPNQKLFHLIGQQYDWK